MVWVKFEKKAEKVDGLRAGWMDSIEPVRDILERRAKRLQLKGKSFNCYPAAGDDKVEMTEAKVTLIYPAISVGRYQQQQLTNAQEYKHFLENHCKECHYSFQIRRCQDETCCTPGSRIWTWLPDPVIDGTGKHFKPFEVVYGLETTEEDRPSSDNQTLAAVAQEQQVLKYLSLFN